MNAKKSLPAWRPPWKRGSSLMLAVMLALVSASPSQGQDVGDAIASSDPGLAVTGHGSSEVAQACTFIDRVIGDGLQQYFQVATDLYLGVISRWGTPMPKADEALVKRLVDQALLVVPESAREGWPADSAGVALANWWRLQDPLPATPTNERLIEHLERVAYARHHFADRRADLGFDHRGKIYVRLGQPSQRRQLDYFRPQLVQRIHELRISMDNNLLVSPSSFNSSEVWYYHGPQPYHFLFVAEGRQYRLGEVTDIIPLSIRSALDATGRGGAKADVILEILRAVYEQLAAYHISYVQRLHDVDGVLSQLEIAAREEAHFGERETLTARRADYSAVMRARGEAIPGVGTPTLAAGNFVEAARREDVLVQREREARAPASHSNVLDGIEFLAIGTHVARFLNRDGTTRAEIYWAPQENALPLSRGLQDLAGERLRTHQDQIVRTTLVRNAGSAARDVHTVHYHTVPRRVVSSVEPLGVQTIVADSLGEGESFAVQWDQLLASIGEDVVDVGPTARIAVLRTDEFELLHGDGRLEMSDLKPMLAATREAYPFQSVELTMPLALYFEVYGLTFGPEDQVDFRVDYEITLRREGGLLRRSREETTSGNLFSTIFGTRTEQYLILDPARWRGAQEAEIQISVSDRNTGHEVRRSITFDLIDR